ncbi:DUF3105 domain-containing protein [Actinotalea sp.]|uniref:DUF3105 domain-containing protein n=1 Tax=Actinotalea sp. TaxID=1872145 RepID=UPI003563C670
MVDRRTPDRARAAQLADLRARQAAKERRSRAVIIAVSATAVVGLVVGAGAVIVNESRRQSAVEQAANQPIAGVEETTDLSSDHVAAVPEPTPEEAGGTVLPPVGGDHDPVPQNCGVYAEPVATANAVHSLEHGAVWITYRPDLAQAQVDVLTELARGEGYVLLSPFPDLAAPVVLTAWGVQLQVDDAADPRVEPFLVKYVQGEQTPEPGAPCSGGVGEPS